MNTRRVVVLVVCIAPEALDWSATIQLPAMAGLPSRLSVGGLGHQQEAELRARGVGQRDSYDAQAGVPDLPEVQQ
jgi:hypothetical protein